MKVEKKDKIEEVIEDISKKYPHVKIYHVKKGDIFCRNNVEYSYICKSCSCGGISNPKPIIWIGIYKEEEKELRLLSLLHEMGHLLNTTSFSYKYEKEKEMWKVTYKLAKEYNITFSKKAIQWASEQLETYNNEQYNK